MENFLQNNTSSYKWYDMIPKIFKSNMGNPMWLPLMAVGVTINTVDNRDQHSLGLDQPSFYPATQTMLSYGIEYPTVQIYSKYAIDAAIFLGANKATAEKDMKDVIEFEILLAKASSKETARNASLVNSTIVSELQDFPCGNVCTNDDGDEGISNPSWLKYFNDIFEASGIENVTVNANDSVVHLNPPYFEALVPILNETNPRYFYITKMSFLFNYDN